MDVVVFVYLFVEVVEEFFVFVVVVVYLEDCEVVFVVEVCWYDLVVVGGYEDVDYVFVCYGVVVFVFVGDGWFGD